MSGNESKEIFSKGEYVSIFNCVAQILCFDKINKKSLPGGIPKWIEYGTGSRTDERHDDL
jgi:hypothetical protein